MVWANWTYSSGTRTGILTKISTKGYLFKTYEGQLNLGGFSTGEDSGIIGNMWSFSLKDKTLYKQMEGLEGRKVQLRYKEVNKSLPWQGDTNYFVYEIESKE